MIFRRLNKVALSRFARFALGRFAPKRFTRFAFFALCALFILCGANLATLNAYDFSKCKEFYLNTSQVFELENGFKVSGIHIGQGQYLAFIGEISNESGNESRNKSSTESNSESNAKSPIKALYYDKFLGLALFQSRKLTQKYDFIQPINAPKGANLVAISDSTVKSMGDFMSDSDDFAGILAIGGNILEVQKSLKNKAKFSREIPPNAVISDICYQSYGISVGDNRFIDKNYITRFLRDFQANKGAKIYSDIGFSVKMQNGALVINSINPFAFGFESLQVGDEILAINGIAVKNENEFFDIASNLEVGKSAQVTIKRSEAIKRRDSTNKGEAILTIHAIPFKRERGFSERGTLLDIFGIIVDDNLLVQKAPPNAIFQKNDRILRLNQIIVGNKAELNSAIWRVLETKSDFSFLISRKDFEFFITFKNEVK